MNGDCSYTYMNKDTDGTKWYMCDTHSCLAPSKDAPCANYIEIPYDASGLDPTLKRYEELKDFFTPNGEYNPKLNELLEIERQLTLMEEK